MTMESTMLSNAAIKEREEVINFLRGSAERIFGAGVYSKNGAYDPTAVHWMVDALELAADAIERGEHIGRPY